MNGYVTLNYEDDQSRPAYLFDIEPRSIHFIRLLAERGNTIIDQQREIERELTTAVENQTWTTLVAKARSMVRLEDELLEVISLLRTLDVREDANSPAA